VKSLDYYDVWDYIPKHHRPIALPVGQIVFVAAGPAKIRAHPD